MEPFTSPLANGAAAPLIVALHGGSYGCDYFDADEIHTAAIPSQAYNVPFVAIDRPCYGGTTPFSPLPDQSEFAQQTGVWMHRYILPALWEKFGKGCSCIVLLCHSLGCQGGIIAAALHAQDETPGYPLGGIVASGMGHQCAPWYLQAPQMEANVGTDYHKYASVEAKDSLMFPPGTADPAILQTSEKLNRPIPVSEANSVRKSWQQWREQWAAHVKVPVMFALVELDCFFEGTREHLQECVEAFHNSPRVDSSLVPGASHCMELSFWSKGWYATAFGFAMECAVDHALKAKV
ncbi:hypothetical protein WHR41_07891 [Cladosporium halotolerans]|uniref:AB hydrolase-1 domain-containing protein n=1 Tax=Cladosporium halotolerans TaxID=1052096 RepID=A0AB34KF52_9PEZI